MDRRQIKNVNMKKITSTFLVGMMFFLAACTNDSKSEDANPHTGFAQTEAEVTPISAQISDKSTKGTVVYVYSERVRARTSPEISETNLAGVLDLNDQVKVVDASPIGAEKFVKIEVASSKSVAAGKVVYVSSKYLSTTKRTLKKEEAAHLKYFMVQNLATEKVRIYERVAHNDVYTNKMVFEADMIAGEDDDGTRSRVGIYRIERWQKFYEDGAKKYPAWYHPNYPMVPAAGSSRTNWFDSDYMPGGNGDARGAFGWYTAIVGPNAAAQWTHGTMGWGADHDEFITYKTGFSAKVLNLFTAIRSHGCTRMDNEAIAYVRHLLPVGSTIVKIYAREALLNKNLPGYFKVKPRWEYILTKTGYGKAGGLSADAATVIAQKIPQSEWLEQGSYNVDQYPDDKDTGNLYDIKEHQFRGVFLVDDGTLYSYEHPVGVGRGGTNDQTFPSYMTFQDSFGN